MNRLQIIDFFRKTSINKKMLEINELEGKDISDAEAIQKEKLVKCLLYSRGKNLFYSKLLKFFSSEDIKNSPEEVLKTLPLTDKSFYQENFNRVFTPDLKNSYQIKHTGGSTGSPFKYFADKESISYSLAFIYYMWKKYSDFSMGDPFITVAGNSLRTNGKKFKEKIYYTIQNNYFIPSDTINQNVKLNKKKISRAKLLYGYPSSINILLNNNPELKNIFNNLKAVFTTSELLLPYIRKSIEDTLKVPVYDMYGANDGGIISSECNEHDGYHYNMLNTYIEEITNANNDKELIATSLNNNVFPFFRYKVGDLGEINKSKCRCGMPFYRIINLLGRTRDTIVSKNKKYYHGSIFNTIFYLYDEIKLYKIIQDKDYTVNVYLIIEPQNKTEEIYEKLKAEFKGTFPDLSFILKKLDHIEASSKKFKIIESYIK